MTYFKVLSHGNYESAAFPTREQADAYTARGGLTYDVEHPEGYPTPYTVVEVDEDAKVCSVCSEQVITSTNPETDFCRSCFYTGAAFDRTFAQLADQVEEQGAPRPSVWHTGGGCFCFAATIGDGQVIVATAAVREHHDDPWDTDAALPKSVDGPWWVARYTDDEWAEVGAQAAGLDAARLVAFFVEQSKTAAASHA